MSTDNIERQFTHVDDSLIEIVQGLDTDTILGYGSIVSEETLEWSALREGISEGFCGERAVVISVIAAVALVKTTEISTSTVVSVGIGVCFGLWTLTGYMHDLEGNEERCEL